MSDKYIEKTFLYLVLLSILLHVVVFGVVSLLPPEPQLVSKEPTMVELQDLPEPPPAKPKPEPEPEPQPGQKQPNRQKKAPPLKRRLLPPEQSLTANKEAAPEANSKIERIVQGKNAPNLPGKPLPNQQAARSLGKSDSEFRTQDKEGREAARGEGFFRPQQGIRNDLAKLFPSTRNMERREEDLRKKYLDAERGDTRLMDTDDPDIGVFAHRYKVALTERLNAIDPMIRKGLGRTVLKVTIKRDGTVADIKILYSTGNEALDDLAIKASSTASYVGPLPKKWAHDELNMICAFTVEEGIVATKWE